MSKVSSPFLQGNFAPIREENSFTDLEVIGTIPEDLNGVLLRNGPNPQFDPIGTYHWFSGDGMIHACTIKNGKASYQNRWIRTERFELERKVGQSLLNVNLNAASSESDIDLNTVSPNTANTNIIAYQHHILALNEGASPIAMQLDNLITLGDYDFDGQLRRRMTAHPRYDFKRQELLTYSYIDKDERLMYYRFNHLNQLISEKSIAWPYPAMLHDFVNTENTIIFPIFPCTMNLKRSQNGDNIFMWEGDVHNTFFIITDKTGEEVARIETEPCYVYHFGNAYEQGNNIIIDAMLGRCSSLMPDRYGKVATRSDSAVRLARWTINLKTKALHLDYLDDVVGEFPRFDERFNGMPYQHLYVGGRASAQGLFDRIMHYDLINNKKYEHHFGIDVPSEPVFVSRQKNAAEGDGYIITVLYRAKENRSDIVILNAQNISAPPLAIIKIPQRIPFGFHGNFVV